jgi:hypothetical protein
LSLFYWGVNDYGEDKIVEKEKKKILSEEERPDMEEVFLKVWALCEAYRYIIDAEIGIPGGLKSGLATLQRYVFDADIRTTNKTAYGEAFVVGFPLSRKLKASQPHSHPTV